MALQPKAVRWRTGEQSRWPLIGRQSELDFLQRALLDNPAGAVITGELGVGKTRLAIALAERLADDGWSVTSHVGTEARCGIPLAPFAALLDTDEGDPFQRMLASAERLHRVEGDRVLVRVEDAHWLDEQSSAFVHHVAESATASVVLTVRAGHPRAGRVDELARALGLTRLALQPLSRPEVRALLDEVLPDVGAPRTQRLWETTRGNPLYLHELVTRSLEQGSVGEPDGAALGDVVDARLDDLDTGQREVLELVTVGGVVPLGLLQRCASAEAVVELERRQLLVVVESDRRLMATLAHPIYGEVVAARMGAATRRARRRELLTELSRHDARRRSDLVHLAVWGIEQGTALEPELLLGAARRLSGYSHGSDADGPVPPLRGGVLTVAARLAKAATDGGGGFDAAHCWFSAEAHADGTSAATLAALVRMGELASTEDERTLVVTAATTLHLLNGWQSLPEAFTALEAAREDAGVPAARRSVDALLVFTMALFGRNREAVDLGLAVLADPDTTPRDRLITAGPLVGSLVWLGRNAEALALADEVLAEVDAASDQWSLGALVFARISALACTGRLQEADETAAQLVVLCEVTGNDLGLVLFGSSQAQVAQSRGRPADAIAASVAALAACGPSDPGVASYRRALHASAAHGHALLGHREAANAELALATATQTDAMVFDVSYLRAKAWVAVSDGRHGAAVEVLRDAIERAVGEVQGQMSCLSDLVRLGEPGTSAMTQAVIDGGADGALWAAYHAHAVAFDAADGVGLDTAAESLNEAGATLVAADAAAQAADAHHAAGSRSAASASRARSHQLAAQCQGASTPALARAREVVQSLTKRELEVARMAAAGSLDREIAEELSLSVRTVETYLYRIYFKLGIEGRADLAAHLER